MIGVSTLGIIRNEFRHGKKPCSIILLKVNKSSDIGFYHTILPLSLTICLQIEGDKKFLLDTKEIA